jgi:hypothetical protein
MPALCGFFYGAVASWLILGQRRRVDARFRQAPVREQGDLALVLARFLNKDQAP